MHISNSGRNITLIGAGIMSASLSVLLKKVMPDSKITIYERLGEIGKESSDAWNNAGTGHSAFCELNYTPMDDNGNVDISKALSISQQFEVSKQFWAYLTENNLLKLKTPFINSVPHMSLVMGKKNVEFLKKRYEALVKHAMFEDMEYIGDFTEIEKLAPLMIEGRDPSKVVAATRMSLGTDVNFGAITRGIFNYLQKSDDATIVLNTDVKDIKKTKDGKWKIVTKDILTGKRSETISDFVFVGAGGGALKLLTKSGIPEAKGFGGFPVGGQWLRCTNPEVIKRHEAKVYGKAEVGSPPMSVPHLDTRYINGERCLLFGPFAGFSTKFLKTGSYWDLFKSFNIHNIWPMVSAGAMNIPLTKYLIEQVLQSKKGKFKFLKQYYPEAKIEDWDLEIAGQRVQIIKKHKGIGKLQFGTEVVNSADGSISALLGASPGASTAVSIMLSLMEKCFPEDMKSEEWLASIKDIIPSYGQSLIKNDDLLRKTRARTSKTLHLEND